MLNKTVNLVFPVFLFMKRNNEWYISYVLMRSDNVDKTRTLSGLD